MSNTPTDMDAALPPTRPESIARKLIRRTAKLALIGAAAFAGGFAAFVMTLPAPPADVPAAQGIVVLTGGDERIDMALNLLKQHRGDRLLISGLHASTSRAALRRAHHGDETAFSCCIDLGWEAQNTPGNAVETARWAAANGYASLIVVTASYHMPRALLELSAQMPGVALIPYPVTPDALARDDAWRNPATVELVAGEYVKYVAAQARLTSDSLMRLAGL